MNILEIFTSIQGEGCFTGVPSVFVRFGGCNLRCVFGRSICDTAYSSFNVEESKYNTIEGVCDEIMNVCGKATHLVFTGGEPLLQRDVLKDIINMLWMKYRKDFTVTVETNGTLPAIDPWDSEDGARHHIDLWSISPKLSTSVDVFCSILTPEQRDRHDKIRINPESLATYSNMIQLKFVYSGRMCIDEIKSIIPMLKKEPESIQLMPEGQVNEQLNIIQQECAQVCIEEGWRYCDRLHIRIWGDKRCV